MFVQQPDLNLGFLRCHLHGPIPDDGDFEERVVQPGEDLATALAVGNLADDPQVRRGERLAHQLLRLVRLRLGAPLHPDLRDHGEREHVPRLHLPFEPRQLPAPEFHRDLLLVVFDRFDDADGSEIFADQQTGQPGERVRILGFRRAHDGRENPRRTVQLAGFHPKRPAVADVDFQKVRFDARQLLSLGLVEGVPARVGECGPERLPIFAGHRAEVDHLDAAEFLAEHGEQGRF